MVIRMVERYVRCIRCERNLIGLMRSICEKCKGCEDGKGWKVVVREVNGKRLWGIECEKRGVRVY